MPNPSRIFAIFSLSSTERLSPSLWVPSRRVVSKSWIWVVMASAGVYQRAPAWRRPGGRRTRSGVEDAAHRVAHRPVLVRQQDRLVGVLRLRHVRQLALVIPDLEVGEL